MKVYISSENNSNPYISNFKRSLSGRFQVLDKKFNNQLLLDLLYNSRIADVIVLNWPENLPSQRFGRLKTYIFLLLMWVTRKRKIIWVMHNKTSHTTDHINQKRRIFRTLLKRSSKILCHSSEGAKYALDEYSIDISDKLIYFPHPTGRSFRSTLDHSAPKTIDVLFWGSVLGYKGVLDFLEENLKYQTKLKITIAGKTPDASNKARLMTFVGENITVLDESLPMDELSKLVNASRYVVFNYKKGSVLSSGALVDTVEMGGIILGPDFACFKELADSGLATTFTNYKSLFSILNSNRDVTFNSKGALEYFSKYNWDEFGRFFANQLKK